MWVDRLIQAAVRKILAGRARGGIKSRKVFVSRIVEQFDIDVWQRADQRDLFDEVNLDLGGEG
jgi:hypothetical protein